MNIYILRHGGDYQYPVRKNRKDSEIFRNFTGKPLSKSWEPIKMRIIKNDPSAKNMTEGDFPYFTPGIPLFSERAVFVLKDLLEPHGEFLPLDCKEQKFIAFNVFTFLDVVDMTASEIEYFEGTNRIMFIRTFAFIVYDWTKVVIFKLPQEPKGYVFVTDKFINRVKEAKLKGFDFEKVWEG